MVMIYILQLFVKRQSGEIVKHSLYRYEDLNSCPRAHIKNQVWDKLAMPGLRQKQADPWALLDSQPTQSGCLRPTCFYTLTQAHTNIQMAMKTKLSHS